VSGKPKKNHGGREQGMAENWGYRLITGSEQPKQSEGLASS